VLLFLEDRYQDFKKFKGLQMFQTAFAELSDISTSSFINFGDMVEVFKT
jgi:hypothetical protein